MASCGSWVQIVSVRAARASVVGQFETVDASQAKIVVLKTTVLHIGLIVQLDYKISHSKVSFKPRYNNSNAGRVVRKGVFLLEYLLRQGLLPALIC